MITAIEKMFDKDVSRTPLFGHPGDDHAELSTDAFIEVEETEASGSKALPHGRPLQDKKDVNVKREQASGSFHLLNQILASNMGRKLMSVIGAVGKHLQECHALAVTVRK
jgi:hypothetical protein